MKSPGINSITFSFCKLDFGMKGGEILADMPENTGMTFKNKR